MKKLTVDGITFETSKEAKAAEQELDAIKKIRNRMDVTDPTYAKVLYQKLVEKEMLHTPVGDKFLAELKGYFDPEGAAADAKAREEAEAMKEAAEETSAEGAGEGADEVSGAADETGTDEHVNAGSENTAEPDFAADIPYLGEETLTFAGVGEAASGAEDEAESAAAIDHLSEALADAVEDATDAGEFATDAVEDVTDAGEYAESTADTEKAKETAESADDWLEMDLEELAADEAAESGEMDVTPEDEEWLLHLDLGEAGDELADLAASDSVPDDRAAERSDAGPDTPDAGGEAAPDFANFDDMMGAADAGMNAGGEAAPDFANFDDMMETADAGMDAGAESDLADFDDRMKSEDAEAAAGAGSPDVFGEPDDEKLLAEARELKKELHREDLSEVFSNDEEVQEKKHFSLYGVLLVSILLNIVLIASMAIMVQVFKNSDNRNILNYERILQQEYQQATPTDAEPAE